MNISFPAQAQFVINKLSEHGIQARYSPAEDESVDDEVIVFNSQLTIQLGAGYCATNEFNGEVLTHHYCGEDLSEAVEALVKVYNR